MKINFNCKWLSIIFVNETHYQLKIIIINRCKWNSLSTAIVNENYYQLIWKWFMVVNENYYQM